MAKNKKIISKMHKNILTNEKTSAILTIEKKKKISEKLYGEWRAVYGKKSKLA